jgi:carboxyl-terminal processing protease
MINKILLLTLLSFSLIFTVPAQKTKKKPTKSKPKQPQVFVIASDGAGIAPTPLDETVPPNLTPLQKRRYETFDKVWQTINQYYYDATFGGLDWKAVRAEFRPKLKNLKTDYELHLMLQEMINRFNRSHLFMVLPEAFEEVEKAKAESKRKEIERETEAEKEEKVEEKVDESKEETEEPDEEIFYEYGLEIDVRIIDSQVVVTEIKKGSNAEKEGLKTGYILDKINGVSLKTLIERVENYNAFGKVIKDQMPKIILSFLRGEEDSEVELTFLDENNQSNTKIIKREGLAGELVSILKSLPEQRITFESKTLNEKTGYIRFNFFAFPILTKFCDAMTDFKNKEAIILDLRGNSGGAISVLWGLTALLNNRTLKLGTEITRNGKSPQMINPMPNNYKGKLIILVDGQSVSAAEILASGLQENGRATIIGEKTAGQALPSVTVSLPTGGAFIYPYAGYESPKGKFLEGAGVEPDIKISLDRKTLLSGKDNHIERALSLVNEPPKAVVEEDSDEPPPPVKIAPTPKPTPPIIISGPKPAIIAKPPTVENKQDARALEVINKFIAAIGGETALRKITSYTARGDVEINRAGTSVSGFYDIYRKAPNKIAEVMNFEGSGEIREVFDGKNYLVQSLFMGVVEQSFLQNEFALYADFYEFLRFKEIYPAVIYLGTFDRLGKKVHLIQGVTEKGIRVAFGFDAATNLLVSRAGTFLNYTFEDYQKFDDILIPTTQTRNVIIKIKLRDVKFDTPISDSKFIKEENCFTQTN